MKLVVAAALLVEVNGLLTAQLDDSKLMEQTSVNRIPVTSAKFSPSYTKKKIKQYDNSIINHSKGRPGRADTGILPDKHGDSSIQNRHLALAFCPYSDYIVCANGLTLTPTGTKPCSEECGVHCCDGTKACDLFTGIICKDYTSCHGEKSCYNATIASVYRGCIGASACAYASITTVYEGCDGDSACYGAGYLGYVGDVTEGCVGPEACSYAAEYGYIESIQNSCSGTEACAYAAAGPSYDDGGGSIGTIRESCIGELACNSAAYGYGSIIDDILSSCKNGGLACHSAAAYGGDIGTIANSCLQKGACDRAAACPKSGPGCGSRIAEIRDSCDGIDACNIAAYSGGYIGGVRNACNNVRACFGAAANFGAIDAGINGCCSAEQSDCEGIMNGDNLPTECAVGSTTKTPTNSPTYYPTTYYPTYFPSSSPTRRPTARPTAQSRTKSGKAAKQSKQSKQGKQSKLAKVTSDNNDEGNEEGSYSYKKMKRAREHVQGDNLPIRLGLRTDE